MEYGNKLHNLERMSNGDKYTNDLEYNFQNIQGQHRYHFLTYMCNMYIVSKDTGNYIIYLC